ncbi:MAG: hypothetical protein OQJ89_15975 [Kangiellaceae bacterium]|nr:hypothetical protein [Kangiellaceae bacterium]MCW8998461.1 hypothetical protein [Kangiellaceae bacterium]MCW9018471.1 hypothetical protein [Kangiellaceae bacterium]
MTKNLLAALLLAAFMLGCSSARLNDQKNLSIAAENSLDFIVVQPKQPLLVEVRHQIPMHLATDGSFVSGAVAGIIGSFTSYAVSPAPNDIIEEFEGVVDFHQLKHALLKEQQALIVQKKFLDIRSMRWINGRQDSKRKIGDVNLYVTSDYIFSENLSSFRAVTEVKVSKLLKRDTYNRKQADIEKRIYVSSYEYKSPNVFRIGRSDEEVQELKRGVESKFQSLIDKVKSTPNMPRTEKDYKVAQLKKQKNRELRKFQGLGHIKVNLREWKANDGALLKRVISESHEFMAQKITNDFVLSSAGNTLVKGNASNERQTGTTKVVNFNFD